MARSVRKTAVMKTRTGEILIVDDCPDLLHILRHILSAAGYGVVPACGGEDALRKLHGRRFDLILTDLAMPKVSGLDLIQHVRENPKLSGIPIIAVTAYSWDTIGHAAADLGCSGFISKPVDRNLLLDTVAKQLAHAGRVAH